MAGQDCVDPAAGAAEPVELRRLRWRARRGMLENDLLLGRFLDRYGGTLDAAQNAALLKLLELPDAELLDLLLGRCHRPPPLDTPDVRDLLQLIQTA